jgi:predicted DNA-binding transcriptional regulator AlpA
MGQAVSTATLDSPPSEIRPYIPRRLLGVDDFARLAHVSAGTVRDWIKRGILPAPIRVGAMLRWEPQAIELWLSSRGA